MLLADCGSARLIALIDTEESGAGCQKPQQKQERTLSLLLVWAQSLCWPEEELQLGGGASLWSAP